MWKLKVLESFVTSKHFNSFVFSSFSSESSIANNFFSNRNPRNLERLRIAYKCAGYHLEKPGRDYWYKLLLNQKKRCTTADIVHQSGSKVVSASTAEWAIKKFLYSTVDVCAHQNLGSVFAERCLESGITEVYCDLQPEPDSKFMESNDIIVKLSQGSLQGKNVTSKKTGGKYYSFQGIPYAQPPVGDLRFKAPSAAPTWTGVRDATFERSICIQINDTEAPVGSEDCLYLNVYTPQLANVSGRNLLPVMVWIHGGAFIRGSGNADKYSPDYLVDKGVIFVTMNYRVGVLGFLGLNNSLVSQNNGLKDQLAALKWVQANIAEFGGDKDQVTIFGQSAGGSCVELQVLSPATKGLFHRAISQSGNGIIRWSYIDPSSAKERAFRLGKVLGHTSDDEVALIDFLKGVPAENLTSSQGNAATKLDVLGTYKIPFRPTKESGEGIFLPDSPLNILKSRNYQHVPFITGFVSTEAKYFELDYLHNSSLWTELADKIELFVPPELRLPLDSPESLQLAAEIKKMYFGDDALSVKDIEGLVNLQSDASFVSGVRRSSKIRVNTTSTPVFVYQFSYVGQLSRSEQNHYGYSFRGAGHGDDLGYLFYYDDVQLVKNSTEMSILSQMTSMWTNFAKTGNPGEGLDVQWEAQTPSKKLYLDIDTELSIRNLDELHAKRFAMWDKIFSTIDS